MKGGFGPLKTPSRGAGGGEEKSAMYTTQNPLQNWKSIRRETSPNTYKKGQKVQ